MVSGYKHTHTHADVGHTHKTIQPIYLNPLYASWERTSRETIKIWHWTIHKFNFPFSAT